MADVVSLEELDNWINKGLPKDQPKPRLAVIGDPVAHSLSPQLHQPALDACGFYFSYIRIHVPDGAVPTALEKLRALDFIGCNVTIPHKVAALNAVDEVDPNARLLGAVNTIHFREDGTTHGSNSDGPGLVLAIREEFSIDLRDLRVLILGSGGGAGRAAAMQCALETCERLVLVNRNLDKATELAKSLHSHYLDDRIHGPSDRLTVVALDDTDRLRRELDETDLIIQASPIGMKSSDPLLIPPKFIQPHHLVFDMIYSPPATRLIQTARTAGARAANGLSMLLHQGGVSFETWFNRPAPLAVMRKALKEATNS